MKIFVVYAKVKLTKKPEWLDGFRSKYDKPYEYHITLKQPCVLEDAEVPEVKAKLSSLFSSLKISENKIILTFNSLKVYSELPENTCIMINSESNAELNELQKSILSALGEYKKYFKEKYKKYEEPFIPHITIGRVLDEKAYAEASEVLKQDYTCEGVVSEVVLAVVQNNTVDEVNDPNNQTVYKL
ncbi:MAG: 2'-5' RNA ligase family protein [Minisyncoccia bacterium]